MNFPIHITPFELVLLVAAVARLSMLVANEDGPWLMFRKIRRNFDKWDKQYRWFRKSHLREGIACEYCNSIWFGTGFSVLFVLVPSIATLLALPLALSTGTILIKHIVFLLKSADTRLDQLNNPLHEVTMEKQALVLRKETVYENQSDY